MTTLIDPHERAALVALARVGCDRLSDGMWPRLYDSAETIEAAVGKLATFARLWRLANAAGGTIDTDMLGELRAYRRYCAECLADDSKALEGLRTTRDPDYMPVEGIGIEEGISLQEEQVETSRDELAAVDRLLARIDRGGPPDAAAAS